MKSVATKSFDSGFTINEQELRRLHDTCLQQIRNSTKTSDSTSTYEIKFKNGVTAAPHTIDEILSLENLGSESIQRLSLSVTCTNSQYSIFVQFLNADDPEEESKPIKYKVEGEDRDWVFVTSSLIEERLGRIKRYIPSKKFYRMLPLLVMQIFLAVMMFTPIFTNKNVERIERVEKLWSTREIQDVPQLIFALEREKAEVSPFARVGQNSTSMYFIIFIALALLVTVAEPIVKFLWPSYNFLWGDYIQKYESRRTVKNIILVVVGLGLIVSISANFIYSFLTTR